MPAYEILNVYNCLIMMLTNVCISLRLLPSVALICYVEMEYCSIAGCSLESQFVQVFLYSVKQLRVRSCHSPGNSLNLIDFIGGGLNRYTFFDKKSMGLLKACL